ncbi:MULTISPECIES: Crp/Fnr family transcriptional regulator [unclassified Streptomyces]|uniref:Crp/Fnr family transcriptional regulator n=1 Tax=unclassified Streptomyces TaxID=2593676 RepID=UPI002DD95CA3|nr:MULTISPECIES: Crp/Fnr family transcriptional regulator [unclassified Streptomyces]WSA95040.1 Crp/Fnr family transcriptional regulator [Streptomyces sp. NBC_01795]WSB79460.1 Crp/Fnr family transcriptional regulator [Streptomyces sp. NBC_01775]WSS41047.1 Crp/Fnr family transcriptional regulator [Streptomyces sp. NBC_01187]
MTSSVSADTPAPWRALATVPLLAGLPEARLRMLWRNSPPRRYRAGEVLRGAGDPAEHLLLLLHGRVSATLGTATGRVVRFGEWAGPCALDKVAVIDGRGHTATLTGVTACSVRALPRARFEELVGDAPSVRTHVLRLLADHARHHQERFTDAATLPVEARLASWLLARTAAAAQARVELPRTQQELADLLGTTRVTVNRALSRLRRDGLVEVTRRTATVLAPELMALRAASLRNSRED